MVDISKEVHFRTARGGGPGGQNVNKVESMVIGSFNIDSSELLSAEQKAILQQKLAKKITGEGMVQVKSQVERSQLANRQLVIKKMSLLINQALKQPKKRKRTKPPAITKELRMVSKKRKGELKVGRRKVGLDSAIRL